MAPPLRPARDRSAARGDASPPSRAASLRRAIGFTVEPQPARRGPDGTAWGCFIARKQADSLTVCEQIRDAAGRTWPDPSSWYWPALTGGSQGPWWSTTIVEPR